MCGYCTESIVFSLLLDPLHPEKQDRLSSALQIHAYLQETSSLTDGLAHLTEKARGLPFTQLIVACQGLEVLIGRGFDSPEYQALLANEDYIACIHGFSTMVQQTQAQCTALLNGASEMAWLTENEIFTTNSYLETRLLQTDPVVAEKMLAQYRAACLQESNAKLNLPEMMAEQTENDAVARDHRQQWEDLLFPYLWTSLLWLARNKPDSPLIWELVCNDLMDEPGFNSVGLWLQHKACRIAYDISGARPFIAQLPQIRAELFQYLAVKTKFQPTEIEQLANRIAQQPGGDHQGERFSLRAWIKENKLQLEH